MQVHQSTTEWFLIQKGVRQGCILFPGVFNLYSEYIIKTGGFGNMRADIGKVTWKINTTTHADDTTVLVESNDDISELIKLDKNINEMLGLSLNLQNTRVMRTVERVNIFLDRKDNISVIIYKFLIFLITNESYTSEEIKRRINLSKPTIQILQKS